MSVNLGTDGEGNGKREGWSGWLPGLQITLSGRERSLVPDHSTLPTRPLWCSDISVSRCVFLVWTVCMCLCSTRIITICMSLTVPRCNAVCITAVQPWIRLGGLQARVRDSVSRDCVRPPVPMSWFLPHAGLHLATVHFRSQELRHGTRYCPVSHPCRLSLHSGDFWKLFCFSDNWTDNINCCLMVLKSLHSAPHLILANWIHGGRWCHRSRAELSKVCQIVT